MLSQTCYHVIANMNGVDISGYQSELNEVACQVLDTMPVSYQNEFGIFDFGFYQIIDKTSSGFDDAWQNAIEQALQTKRYNIIFGRESRAEEGIDVNFRVKVNLPDENEFSCLTNEKIIGLEKEMTLILNEKGIPYHKKEIEAMRVFNSFVQRMKDCCAGNRSQFNFIDTTQLKIQVYFDDCGSTPVPKNSVALIVNNTMPNIGLRVSYPQGLTGQFCTEVFVSVSIQYIKTIADNPETSADERERSRDDLEVFKIYNVSLNDFNEINWKNMIRGGRVKVIVRQYEQSPEILKSFDFTIKGINPKIGEVLRFLDEKPSSNSEPDYRIVWFIKKIAYHESDTRVFDISQKMLHFNEFNTSKENLHLNWDQWSRCPNTSYDGGYGLMQLTLLYPDDLPSKRALWDWKQNLKEAFYNLESKKNGVIAKITPNINQVNQWNSNPLNANNKVLMETIEYGGITWNFSQSEFIGNLSSLVNNYFSSSVNESEYSFLDACLILAYNGYGGTNGKNFLKLIEPQGKRPYWSIQDNQNDYVKKISEQFVPAKY